MNSYQLKWKGKISGPHSHDEIMAMFEDRKIGPMHEISVDGNWITLRRFLRQNSTTRSAPPIHGSVSPPPPPHISGADHLRRQEEPAPLAQIPSELPTVETSRVFEADVAMFFAGVWTRACALIIDILAVIYLPLWVIDLFTATEILTVNALKNLDVSSWILFAAAGSFLISIYFVLLECSSLKATLGKACLGMQVVSQTGDKIDFLQSTKRICWKWVSSLTLLSGYFLAVFSPKKLTLHDIKAQTFVVYVLNHRYAFNRR